MLFVTCNLSCRDNISTFSCLSLSHIQSLHPQTCCLSPVRPSRQSSAKKTNVEARIANSASTSRQFPSSSPCGQSPQKNKKKRKHASPRVSVDSGYQQPTVSSRTRALSPYTHRKMCQLSEDARQRLSHLQLGPHHFRKETESQPPFVVGNIRCVPPN